MFFCIFGPSVIFFAVLVFYLFGPSVLWIRSTVPARNIYYSQLLLDIENLNNGYVNYQAANASKLQF